MTIIVSHGNVLLLLILTLPAFADASDQGEAAQGKYGKNISVYLWPMKMNIISLKEVPCLLFAH